MGSARKQLTTFLSPRPGPPVDQVLVNATCLMSRGLPWILVLLNGAPVIALVNTGAELSLVSPNVVQWAGLSEVDCDCPLLVMGESMEVQ